MKYLIATHARFDKVTGIDTFGPAHSVYEYLKARGADVTIVKHSTHGGRASLVITPEGSYDAGKRYDSHMLVKSLAEGRINKKLLQSMPAGTVFIGVDPVNAISGIGLRRRGRIAKFIFLTADYADKRFGNPLLNFVYHFIDRRCVRNADEVWNVSTRIAAKRKAMGLADAKNKFLPNSPSLSGLEVKPYDGNRNLVIVSNLAPALNLAPVLEAAKIAAAKHDGVKLVIVGSGDAEYFRKMARDMGAEKLVEFTGQKNHAEVMDILKRSFLGFALYTDASSWNRYGDSMKAREYLACGLPVIMNDVPSTADDIAGRECGMIVHDISPAPIAEFISKCIEDKLYYENLRRNALQTAADNDKDKILKDLLGI